MLETRLTSKRLGASQVALSCDPIVFFEGVPDLVLKFTIFRSGQSFCDLVRSRYRVELRSHRSFGVKVHQLANLEFVFAHAGIEPPDGHARRAARRQVGQETTAQAIRRDQLWPVFA